MNQEQREKYKIIERLMFQVIDKYITHLNDEEKKDLYELIEIHGEYGLAFDSLVNLLVKYKIKIDDDTKRKLNEVAELMQLPKPTYQ